SNDAGASSIAQEAWKEGWDDFEAMLRKERIAIEDRQHEITALAGQEGLPIPIFFSPLAREQDAEQNPLSSITPSHLANLEITLADTIQATEKEIASLDDKLDRSAELAAQLKNYQDALDVLLARKREITERRERFQFNNP